MHLSRKKQQRTRTSKPEVNKPENNRVKFRSKFRYSEHSVDERSATTVFPQKSSNRFHSFAQSSRRFTPYRGHHDTYRGHHDTYREQQDTRIKTHNMFVFSDSESEAEVDDKPDDTNDTNEAISPFEMLKSCIDTRIYRVEQIEGLKLLGFIQPTILEKHTKDIIRDFTDNCKTIHNQYMENDKRKKFNHKRNFKKKKPKKYKSEITADDFAVIRNFKKTEVKRDEEGVTRTKSVIRASLNKITDKTYQKIKEKIQNDIQELIDQGANEEDYQELSYFIFDVACSNQFFGRLYADLFQSLLEYMQEHKYTFMVDAMNKRLTDYSRDFMVIRSADPTKEYDKFCEINKENERRRAFFGFLGCLLNSTHINRDWIGELIHSYIIQTISYINRKELMNDEQETKRYIEEISEVVYSFMKQAGVSALSLNLWEPIFNNCLSITQMKKTGDMILPPKAKFKYMDILDMIKKWDIAEK